MVTIIGFIGLAVTIWFLWDLWKTYKRSKKADEQSHYVYPSPRKAYPDMPKRTVHYIDVEDASPEQAKALADEWKRNIKPSRDEDDYYSRRRREEETSYYSSPSVYMPDLDFSSSTSDSCGCSDTGSSSDSGSCGSDFSGGGGDFGGGGSSSEW